MKIGANKLQKDFKKRVEPFLESYFDKKIHQAGEIDITTKEAIKILKNFTMSGGKRIRPALLYYSYLAMGGKDCEKILKISITVELLHSFLLIHDDIIDKDTRRHGVATIHERYKKVANKYNLIKDTNHFGNSMAIISGDMAISMAYDIVSNADFSNNIILKVFDELQKIIFITSSGEMNDVVMGHQNKTKEKQILEMYERKTAYYTFNGPIRLGCILAKANKSDLDLFSKYALPLGKAFQIKDDILGIFENVKKIDKTIGSDITEGKKTLLVMKALENGDSEQRRFIKKCLNKKNISKKEIEKFKKIVKKTGSLEYSENLAKGFASEALNALIKINFKDNSAKKFFTDIVDYIIS